MKTSSVITSHQAQILRALVQTDRTGADLARAAHIPSGSIYVLLGRLVGARYCAKQAGKRYGLTGRGRAVLMAWDRLERAGRRAAA